MCLRMVNISHEGIDDLALVFLCNSKFFRLVECRKFKVLPLFSHKQG